MKVRFLMGYRYQGKRYAKGDTADLDDKFAARIVAQGVCARVAPESASKAPASENATKKGAVVREDISDSAGAS